MTDKEVVALERQIDKICERVSDQFVHMFMLASRQAKEKGIPLDGSWRFTTKVESDADSVSIVGRWEKVDA